MRRGSEWSRRQDWRIGAGLYPAQIRKDLAYFGEFGIRSREKRSRGQKGR